jgi:uncharacterized protein (DUF362 family)/NAD-dependent dihydropyrimidine dehydrogenase PreA subunit
MKYIVSVVDAGYQGEVDGALLESLRRISWSPSRGESYLIKPNMITAKTSEQGVTTDPRIVKAMACHLKDMGAKPTVGDSPGNAVPGRAQEVFEKTRMMDAVRECGAEYAQFEELPPKIVELDGGLIRSIGLARHIFGMKLINIPKLKTHAQAVMTGGIKNLAFGCIPGAGKSTLHSVGNNPEKFGRVIVDVYSAVKPFVDLNVMDAIVGMDGNGPTMGRVRRVGKILASRDALALDMVSFKMVGMEPEEVPHVAEAIRRGMGPSSLDEVEILGDLPTGLKYRLPYTVLSSMACRIGAVVPAISPFPNASPKCTRCGTCASACPVAAITVKDVAVVDKHKCIKCYVCHEVCEYDAMLVQRHRIR